MSEQEDQRENRVWSEPDWELNAKVAAWRKESKRRRSSKKLDEPADVSEPKVPVGPMPVEAPLREPLQDVTEGMIKAMRLANAALFASNTCIPVTKDLCIPSTEPDSGSDVAQSTLDVSKGSNLSNLSVGIACELAVSRDLLCRGYNVFRAVSPDADCAFVVKDRHTNVVLFIQVRAGKKGLRGAVVASNRHQVPEGHILAAVDGDGSITYTPELPSLKVK